MYVQYNGEVGKRHGKVRAYIYRINYTTRSLALYYIFRMKPVQSYTDSCFLYAYTHKNMPHVCVTSGPTKQGSCAPGDIVSLGKES